MPRQMTTAGASERGAEAPRRIFHLWEADRSTQGAGRAVTSLSRSRSGPNTALACVFKHKPLRCWVLSGARTRPDVLLPSTFGGPLVRRFSVHEDLERKTRRGCSRLVRRRRRGSDPRAAGHAHRRHAARQAQAPVHPAHRHGRLRRRRERREDRRHRQEAGREDVPAALGLPGRSQGASAPRGARAAADRGAAQGRQGDAAAQPPRARAAAEAEDLRRPRASPRGTGAQAPGSHMSSAQTERAQYSGTGKRKTAVARVILRPGDGTTWFNGKTIEEYFPRRAHRSVILAPLQRAGFLTRDARIVERKKAGLHKARKAPQFSKR